MKRDPFTTWLPASDPRAKRTRLVWRSMHARCSRPGNISFPRYGGRGIVVCERWHDYAVFVGDMGYAPDGLSIERIDSDGMYSPENCTWATPKEPARNRCSNRLISFRGETKPMSAWAESLGIDRGTLWRRLRGGAPLDIVLTRPLARGKPMLGKQKPRRRSS